MISAARRTRASHGNIHDRRCCCYWQRAQQDEQQHVASRFSLSSKQSSMESFPQTLLSARCVVFFILIFTHRTWLQSLQDLFNRHFFPSASSRFYLILKLSVFFSAERKSWSEFAYPWRIHSTCECATSPQEMKHLFIRQRFEVNKTTEPPHSSQPHGSSHGRGFGPFRLSIQFVTLSSTTSPHTRTLIIASFKFNSRLI